MEIEKYNYKGDTNIGFYATLTDEYAVVPRDFDNHELLPDKIVKTRIAGTQLIGLFTAGNSNSLLVPETIKDREKERLEEEGVPFQTLETTENALGNLILANEKGAYISPRLENCKEEISEALEVPVTVGEIAGIPNTGVCGVANSRGALIHRDASEEEAEKVKEALGVERLDIGTVNMGSPYISSGLLCNNDLILISYDTTGPELGRIDRILVEKD